MARIVLVMLAIVLGDGVAFADSYAIIDRIYDFGQSTHVTLSDAAGVFSGSGDETRIEVNYDGGVQELWSFSFAPPAGTALGPGVYLRAQREGFQSPVRPGLAVAGRNLGCNDLDGEFVILEIEFGEGGVLNRLAVNFRERCVEGVLTSIGILRLNSDIPVDQPTPVAPTATPTPIVATTYARFDSDPGSWVGAGRSYLLMPSDGAFTVTNVDNVLEVDFDAGHDNQWSFRFAAPRGQRLTAGQYYDAQDYPFGSPVLPRLSIGGNGRGCNEVSGSFVVFEAEYAADGSVTKLAINFTQFCGGYGLRGLLRINSNVPESMPTPTRIPATPTPRIYETFISFFPDEGEYVTGGKSHFFNEGTSAIAVSYEPAGGTYGEHIRIDIDDSSPWALEFAAPFGESLLGSHDEAQRFPFAAPFRPSLSISGDGRGCNRVSGAFHVSELSAHDGVVESLAIDFEHRCEGGSPRIRGSVRIRAVVPTPPPDRPLPLTPTPTPTFGSTPDIEDEPIYVLTNSDKGDFIGEGRAVQLSSRDGLFFSEVLEDGTVHVWFTGEGLEDPDEAEDWGFEFAAPKGEPLSEGYYGGATRRAFRRNQEPGIDVSANGRGCNRIEGSFSILDLEIDSNGSLRRLAADFEQHCEGVDPALRGVLRFHSDIDSTASTPTPRPPTPTPTRPTATATRIGDQNFVIFDSEPGDPVGLGETATIEGEQITIARHLGSTMRIGGGGWEVAIGDLGGDLVPGFHQNAMRYPGTERLPGLEIKKDRRRCVDTSGFFYIFEAEWGEGEQILHLAANVIQRCNDGSTFSSAIIRYHSMVPADQPVPVAPTVTPTPLFFTTYARMDSQPFDYIGGGRSIELLPTNGSFTIQRNSSPDSFGDHIDARFMADDGTSWFFNFSAPIGEVLAPGFTYVGAQRFPFQSPRAPGLSVGGEGRACNTVTGEFTILELVDGPGGVESFSVEFEHHCEGAAAALFGSLRVNSGLPPAPTPTATATPDSARSFLRFDSPPFEFITGGGTKILTGQNGTLTFAHNGGSVAAVWQGPALEDYYSVVLAAPLGTELVPGSYVGAVSPFVRDGAKPGLEALGFGRGCATVDSSFVVYEAAYGPGNRIERFAADAEHGCGGVPKLHISVRINSDVALAATPTPTATQTQLRPTPTPTATVRSVPNDGDSSAGGGCSVGTPVSDASPLLASLLALLFSRRMAARRRRRTWGI